MQEYLNDTTVRPRGSAVERYDQRPPAETRQGDGAVGLPRGAGQVVQGAACLADPADGFPRRSGGGDDVGGRPDSANHSSSGTSPIEPSPDDHRPRQRADIQPPNPDEEGDLLVKRTSQRLVDSIPRLRPGRRWKRAVLVGSLIALAVAAAALLVWLLGPGAEWLRKWMPWEATG